MEAFRDETLRESQPPQMVGRSPNAWWNSIGPKDELVRECLGLGRPVGRVEVEG